MRDKVIAVIDITCLVALVVCAFTWSAVALEIAGVLTAVAVGCGWRDRKDLRPRSSWRYWTEPRLDQAARWSPTYWGTLTLALLMIAVIDYRLDPAEDGIHPGNFFMTLAVMTAAGWWRARRDPAAAHPTGRDRR